MSTLSTVAHALRMLRRNPWFSLAAGLSLAIGIGASTTMFTLFNALLLRPLPGVGEPKALVIVHRRAAGGNGLGGFSLPAYRDLRQAGDSFSGLAAFTDRALSLRHGGEAQVVAAQVVSGNYFDVLGAHPGRGRFFLPEEDGAPGAHPVAVVSYTLWQRRFAGDPSLVGRQIVLNGASFTVIGVTARGFGGTFFGFVYDVWVPAAMAESLLRVNDLGSRDNPWLEVVGRLRRGVSQQRAQAEVTRIAKRLGEEYPRERTFETVLAPVTGFDEELHGGIVVLLTTLMVAALFVLAIACANVANMMLARSAARSKEIAIRIALGMGRPRLIGQLLTESVVLALAGGTAGSLSALWGVALLRRFEPPLGVPLVFDFRLDWRVLGFALLLSALSGLGFGLAPAWRAARPDLVPALRDAAGLRGRGSLLRHAFVVGQIASSLPLLVTAALFMRALQHASSLTPGFDPRGVEVAALDPSVLGYDRGRSEDLFLRLGERVAALPGVRVVSLADSTPLGLGNLFGGNRTEIEVAGAQPPPGQQGLAVSYSRIGPRYFELLRIPLLRGRDFTAGDRATSPRVAIVNQTMARHLWPGSDPIGKRFLHQADAVEIVGLASDSKYGRADEAPRDFLYLPQAQGSGSRLSLFVRTAGRAGETAAALRRTVRELAPNLPILNLMSMEESIAVARLPQRIAAAVAGVLGVTGLLLAALGVYGVVAYSVSRSRRAIAIRMAVGARRHDVLLMVVRQGALLALGGVALGALAGLALSRLLAGLLLGLEASDPVSFLGISALLFATAILATLLPARRAAEIEPMMALRGD